MQAAEERHSARAGRGGRGPGPVTGQSRGKASGAAGNKDTERAVSLPRCTMLMCLPITICG